MSKILHEMIEDLIEYIRELNADWEHIAIDVDPYEIPHELEFQPLMKLAQEMRLENAKSLRSDEKTKPPITAPEPDIPKLDKESGEWINQDQTAKKEGVTRTTLAVLRSKPNHKWKSWDGCSGIDASGRMWRKETKFGKTIFYYVPSLRY